MSKYIAWKNKSAKEYKRLTGVNKAAFEILLEKLKSEISQNKEEHPKSKRGRKSEIGVEDQLLLFLLYLRSYPTFIVLGEDFKISESYANKIFHKISKHMIKILKLPSNNELSFEGLKAVVIDASEQPIERPLKNQKDYYSGKKNDIR